VCLCVCVSDVCAMYVPYVCVEDEETEDELVRGPCVCVCVSYVCAMCVHCVCALRVCLMSVPYVCA